MWDRTAEHWTGEAAEFWTEGKQYIVQVDNRILDNWNLNIGQENSAILDRKEEYGPGIAAKQHYTKNQCCGTGAGTGTAGTV